MQWIMCVFLSAFRDDGPFSIQEAIALMGGNTF